MSNKLTDLVLTKRGGTLTGPLVFADTQEFPAPTITSSLFGSILGNSSIITQNITIPENYNALLIGPNISFSDGVTITLSAGANLTIFE